MVSTLDLGQHYPRVRSGQVTGNRGALRTDDVRFEPTVYSQRARSQCTSVPARALITRLSLDAAMARNAGFYARVTIFCALFRPAR